MDSKLLTTVCAVPFCDTNRTGQRHMFPKNSVLGQQWVKAVNHSVLSTLLYEEIRRKAYWICHKHFSPESCYFGGQKTLKSDAVPSLFLPPQDENVQKVVDLPIDAAPTNSPKMLVERNVFYSMHYNKSPSSTAIRKSSLRTPNTSPRITKPPEARKRVLSSERDGDIVLPPSKKCKPSIIQSARSKGTCFLDTTNIHAFPGVPESTSNFTCSKSFDNATVEPNCSEDRSTSQVLKEVSSIIVDYSIKENLLAGDLKTSNNTPICISTASESPCSIIAESSCRGDAIACNTPLKAACGEAFCTTSTSAVPKGKGVKKLFTAVKSRRERRWTPEKDKMQNIDVTPKGRRVITDTLRLQKELSRCRKQLKRKTTRTNLQNNCLLVCKNYKHLSSTQQAIVHMQLRDALKDPKGRRFTEEEKNMALAIYKRSPTAYRFLTDLLILPSISTIKRNLARIELDTGMNSNIYQLLKECADSITDEKDKVVILMWDETHLKTEVHYDYKKDKIIGFEDFGDRRTSKFANKILVFMIRGLWSNTKLPISYYYANGATRSADMASIVQENIKMVQDAGFQVVATVCDAGSANNKVLNCMRDYYTMKCREQKIEPDPREGVIELNGSKICLLHDTVHLFKCCRNLLLNYLLEIDFKDADRDSSKERKFVKWEHYQTAFEMDVNSGLYTRYIPKVTEVHVRKDKVKRMKVSHCCHIFSRSMAEWIHLCTRMEDYTTTEGTFKMEKEAINTAHFTFFQDELFDSLNARKTKRDAIAVGKPLQQVVTDDSPHLEFWRSAVKKFENMRYRTMSKANPPRANETRRRFIRTLKLMPDLWKNVKDKGLPYMKTGYVNQDPLENFFGRLKAYGGRNVSPSCFQAESQLKSLMVSDLSGKHSIGANCMDDGGTALATLGSFTSKENDNTERSGKRHHEFDEVAHPVAKKQKKWSPVTAARRIISAGQFASIVLSNIKGIDKCKQCSEGFFSQKQNDNIEILRKANVRTTKAIAHADYYERGFTMGVGLLEKTLPSIGFQTQLRMCLKDSLRPLDFEWVNCDAHRHLIKHHFLESLVLDFINNWCVHLNQILAGHKRITDGNLIEKEARRQYLSIWFENCGRNRRVQEPCSKKI